MRRILVYGIGINANFLVDHIPVYDEKIVGFVQTEKEVDIWKGLPVYSFDEINQVVFDEIWIANGFIETLDKCLQKGIEKDRIVVCNMDVYNRYSNKNRFVDVKYMKTAAEMFDSYINSRCSKVETTTIDRFHFVPYLTKNHGHLKHHDYCRYATLGLLVEEIINRKISGELAELGVFQGKFSSAINELLPDRKLYLFDTFEGFPQEDVEVEEKRGYTPGKSWQEKFKDTSEEYVLRQMKYPENCVICKGYFPDTIPDEDISFALVSLDVDMYRPTLEGLRYFYSRLVPGGYIMIHDYNHEDRWLGVKQAINEYEKEIGPLVKVPIPDEAGTMIIGKQ